MSGVWIFDPQAQPGPVPGDDDLAVLAAEGIADAFAYLGHARDVLSVLALWLATRPADDPLRAKLAAALDALGSAQTSLTEAAGILAPQLRLPF